MPNYTITLSPQEDALLAEIIAGGRRGPLAPSVESYLQRLVTHWITPRIEAQRAAAVDDIASGVRRARPATLAAVRAALAADVP